MLLYHFDMIHYYFYHPYAFYIIKPASSISDIQFGDPLSQALSLIERLPWPLKEGAPATNILDPQSGDSEFRVSKKCTSETNLSWNSKTVSIFSQQKIYMSENSLFWNLQSAIWDK